MKKAYCILVFLFGLTLHSSAQKAYILKEGGGDCHSADIEIPVMYDPSTLGEDKAIKATVTDMKKFRMTIFNQQGGKSFEVDFSIMYNAQTDVSSEGIHQRIEDLGWIEGKNPSKGSYFYIIDGTCLDGGHYKKRGSIIITQ